MTERGGSYLYAVGRGVDTADLVETRGLRGAPLRVVEHQGLGAVVSDVDLVEFGEEGLRRNLEHLGWLEEVARTHDAVVRAVVRVGPAAPLRLATVCFDDEQVRARIEEWYTPLVRALDRVEGRVEWSVKAYALDHQEQEAATSGSAQGRPASGAAYLRQRKEETLRRQRAGEDAAREADRLYAVLAEQAVASRRLHPQDRRLTGHEGSNTLNAAYLVDAASSEEFAAAVRQLAAEQDATQVEVSGPWPSYSFATLEER